MNKADFRVSRRSYHKLCAHGGGPLPTLPKIVYWDGLFRTWKLSVLLSRYDDDDEKYLILSTSTTGLDMVAMGGSGGEDDAPRTEEVKESRMFYWDQPAPEFDSILQQIDEFFSHKTKPLSSIPYEQACHQLNSVSIVDSSNVDIHSLKPVHLPRPPLLTKLISKLTMEPL